MVVTGTQDAQVLEIACALGKAAPSDVAVTMTAGANFIAVD